MYSRPHISFPEYRDESGAPIPYGERRDAWENGSPPDDFYSRSIHPERFEVAWTLARALVDYLVAEYDVDVIADEDPAEGRLGSRYIPTPREPVEGAPPAVRRIVPRGAGTPLTVVETPYPGVTVLAGLTLEARAPACGCDACDDSVEEMADDLEDFVFAVAAGAAWEGYERRGVAQRIGEPGRGSSSWGLIPRAERRAARAALKATPEIVPWPRRALAAGSPSEVTN